MREAVERSTKELLAFGHVIGRAVSGITCVVTILVVLALGLACSAGEQEPGERSRADHMLADYFRAETTKLRDRCLADIETLDDWKAKRPVYRKQLFEMLGLDPLPERTALNAVVTGTVSHEEFVVENIHYQSRPGLYVTANLYIPKGLDKPAPAILYVCGHGPVKKDGVSYGNKVRYQHHPAWFARHGYVCLVIDTVQLGEIEGIHHGTYRYNMWWWNSRGYTPAGVEAWNCIRSLDYLETRDEVDANRIGVTGRSGGGAYSWWLAALDDRIKVAVPVAGITDLENHVVDGCVEGHCDCMYIVNTYRWDYPLVAALVAPRPLLISNTDKDRIFPLDGVIRLHEKVRRIYRLYNAEKNFGLHITEGPHGDTQELRIHAFVWFDRFLKEQNRLIEKPAAAFFEPEQLRVLDELPDDRINADIHESFVRRAPQPSVPASADEWAAQRGAWMTALREKSFRGWPSEAEAGGLEATVLFSKVSHGLRLRALEFSSQPYVRLHLYIAQPAELGRADSVVLNVLDEPGWARWLAAMSVGFASELGESADPEPNEAAFRQLLDSINRSDSAMAWIAPRGIGPNAWTGDERRQTHIRRRFMLLGQTLDAMRVWDVRRAMQVLDGGGDRRLVVSAGDRMAGVAVYAALFESQGAGLDLWNPAQSHVEGPIFLNVLRYLDVPQAVAMAAEHASVTIHQTDQSEWHFPREVAERLGWQGRIYLRLE